MSDSITPLTIAEHLYLEIPEALEVTERAYSTPGGDRRSWLNQICWQSFLPWFKEEIAPDAELASNESTLASYWEIINGTPIELNNYRLILIPSLAIDSDELRVAQEWVDIPEWIADYYVAVRVNPDDDCIAICGYTNHHKLKTQGNYDPADRTYSLPDEDLISDLNVLWVTQQTTVAETLRAEVATLSPIPTAQAENLFTRLGNSTLKFPRLSVPFALWGALLSKDNGLIKLFHMRQGLEVKQYVD